MDSVIVVGELGSAYRFDGTCWERMETGLSAPLRAVWGSAMDDVHAGGDGVLAHYDGTEWRQVAVDLGYVSVSALWGSARDDVYAGGSSMWEPSRILHFDGERWQELRGVWLWVEDLWGSGDDDIYAVGLGSIGHFDGVAFEPIDVEESLFAVWGRSAEDVVAAGDRVYRLERGILEVEASPGETVYGLAGTGAGPMIAVGGGGLLLREERGAWSAEQHRLTRRALHALWGSSLTDVYVVGAAGTVLHYDGARWSEMDSGVTWDLMAVFGTGPDSVYAAGWDGSILHYDGSAWRRRPVPGWADRWVSGLWGTADDDLYATAGGEIFHFDGSAWSEVASTGGELLRGISGRHRCDVAAVGDRGVVLRFDGSTWSSFGPGSSEALHAVWIAPNGEVFAAGRDTVLHHDLERWNVVFRTSGGALRAVWGSGEDDVYAAGDFVPGVGIVHFDGSTWAPMATGASEDLAGLWGHGPGAVFAVGLQGAVLRHRR